MKVKLSGCYVDIDKITNLKNRRLRVYNLENKKVKVCKYSCIYDEDKVIVINKQEYKLLKKIMEKEK